MKNYTCCLVDLEIGIVFDFLENRQKETLTEYFKAKDAVFCNQIEPGLDSTRKLLRKTLPEKEDFKNLHWALLINPAKLSDDENQKLQKAFEASSE
jgi:hypothetical protein